MIFKKLYRTSGGIYYYRLIRSRDNIIWNNTTWILEAAPAWTDSVITITEISGQGVYPIIIPSALPKGYTYDLVVYAGCDPVSTDVVDSGHILKHGSTFGF